MTDLKFEKEMTGLLLIDPYNDFISEGGKLWDRIKSVAEANECIPHMLQLVTTARQAGVRVFYAMHHRYRPGDYETWTHVAPVQEHWCFSGFANTDLDLQLKRHGIRKLIARTYRTHV